ncbi:MAG TPA: hypothetical protein VN632_03460 [Stellaceae bacterium]|nr:hypothetical protein [Stellaceae bacterium]
MTEKNAAAAETDLNRLIADVQAMKRDIAALAEHSRGSVLSGASEAADAISAEAQRLYDSALKQGRRQVKALSHEVEEQPLLSILIAFGIGFLGGRILPR